MTQTSDHRVFLGLHQPPLISATQWLVERFQSSDQPRELNLSHLVIVLPTLRAQQRLLQLLVTAADEQELMLTPPHITTVGMLPELLYVAEKDLASDLAQQIAWSKALEEGTKEEIQCLTGRPEVEDLQDWQSLATLISRLHQRLANDIWSFRSVANKVKDIHGFLHNEQERWDALNAIQQRYYSILHGVNLWDKQAARNFAAAGLLKADPPVIRCKTDKHIVMLAAADLNRSVSEMLRQVAAGTPDQIDILIAADASMADRFDDFGSLITEQWLDRPVEIADEQILIVDQPADQADATTFYLTNLQSEFSADEITIGIPDPGIVPQLCRSLNAIGVEHRNLAGRALSETAPVRLMIACRDFLEEQNYEAFAQLVRHPDMFHWLSSKTENDGWIKDLDLFQNFYLPNLLEIENQEPFGSPEAVERDFDEADKSSEKRAIKQAASVKLLNQIHQHVGELLKPLAGEQQAIANWSRPWSEILVQVYGDRLLDKTDSSDRQILIACEAIYSALGNHKQVPEKFDAQTTASTALDWAIEAATEHRIVQPPIPGAIELAGWLDLPLDDAPVMVITNVNDEQVPSTEVGHQFLPNELCKTLEILDNDRRYARDVYALTVVASVRKNLLLVVGRRDQKGEPKKPSRLLFTEDHQSAARRAKAFFAYKGRKEPARWITQQTEFSDEQLFEIPMPVCSEPFKNVSVTKFKDFIKCPYRFYLNHKLKLESNNDNWRELSGGTFGDLTHNVVESFGQSELKDSADAKQILDFFNECLNEIVKQQFFGSRLPAVRIQVEQLRQRLERFADCQALRRQQGWKIVSTEEHLFHDFIVDNEPFVINGKIDRVDQHEETGQVAIWDYKSSDAGRKPGDAHYRPRKKEWEDLQLPLYRHLVKEVSAVEGADLSDVILGYILLPKKLDDVGFHAVDWTPELLQTADTKAREIVRKIRGGVFWPPTADPPKFSEEFAVICQDNVFEKYDTSLHGQDEEEMVPPW